MSLIIENNNRHEHNGNGISIDQIVSSCVPKKTLFRCDIDPKSRLQANENKIVAQYSHMKRSIILSICK